MHLYSHQINRLRKQEQDRRRWRDHTAMRDRKVLTSELSHIVWSRALLCQAMWELVRDGLDLHDGDLRHLTETLSEARENQEELDMSMLWMAGMGSLAAHDAAENISTKASELLGGSVGGGGNMELREVKHQVERLALLNQAMWELLSARLNLTDADIEAKVQEVDLRDGVADGKMTAHAVTCPQCNRVCNSRHEKCIYCGQLFEKPVFG